MIKRTSTRQSNMELLRIFAMLLIIAHHIGAHSGFDLSGNMPGFNRIWIQFIQTGGKIGVNIFVLISGYFLITAESLKLSKAAKLWIQLLTYSVGMYLLFVLLGEESFSVWNLVGRLLPVANSFWWYARTYFILFILSPFINRGLNALGRKAYLCLLLILTVWWSLIPTVSGGRMESNSLLWFIYLYALAGYIRLHADIKRIASGMWFLAALALTAAAFLLALLLDKLGVEAVFDPHSASFFYDMQKLHVLLISVTFFMAFLTKDMKYSPAVNILSSATFGVYLLHDYGDMRDMLWKTLLQNSRYQDSRLLIPYTLLQIIGVFAVCAGIELFRIYLIENRYMARVESLTEKIRSFFAKRK